MKKLKSLTEKKARFRALALQAKDREKRHANGLNETRENVH